VSVKHHKRRLYSQPAYVRYGLTQEFSDKKNAPVRFRRAAQERQ
jgi:hypothetical protein